MRYDWRKMDLDFKKMMSEVIDLKKGICFPNSSLIRWIHFSSGAMAWNHFEIPFYAVIVTCYLFYFLHNLIRGNIFSFESRFNSFQCLELNFVNKW